MTSTHGRKALPLPVLLRDGLEAAGFFVELDTDPPRWRHLELPDVKLVVVASNIPGSQEVSATFGGVTARVDAQVVLAEALLRLDAARNGERKMTGA